MADQIAAAAEDDGRVPDIQFQPMMTGAEVNEFLRDHLDGKLKGLQQALILATFDRPRLVAFLRDLDDDAKMNVVESATDFSKWAKDMADIAEASAVRSLVAVAEIGDMLKPAHDGAIEDAERADLFAAFDRIDARAHDLNEDNATTEKEWDAWGEESGAVLRRVISLPNTSENLRLRARAVGSGCENTTDLAQLDLRELSAHAEGYVGEIVRQVLALLVQEAGE